MSECQQTGPAALEELTPRPDTPPDRTALRSIPDLDDMSLGLGTKISRSGINLRVVRSGGVSGLGVSSSTTSQKHRRTSIQTTLLIRSLPITARFHLRFWLWIAIVLPLTLYRKY